ncbi:MAG TPA: periplasmic heavy metal sensor [Methylomirabilota bacterium]
MQTSRIVVVSIALLTASAAGALAGDRPAGAAVVPVIHEEMSRSLGDLIEQFEGLSSQVRDHFTRDRPRPIISIMLSHRDELGLSSGQVQALERLRIEFQKEATRVEADIRVAEMDLGQLQSAEPVDMKAVEGKIRQIEKRRGDLRLAQARTIESGRAQLSADQREKLRALLAQQDPPLRAFPTPTPPGGPSRL